MISLHLPSPMREDAAAGRVNIVNRIAVALGQKDWVLDIRGEGDEPCALEIYHMRQPDAPGVLCLRRAYFYWFLKLHTINGGAPEAEEQILARLRAGGWPI